MPYELPFERPVIELKAKIDELCAFSQEKSIDFSAEIAVLEERYAVLENELYAQLTPAQRMQLARHPQRPTCLTYIQHIFTDFVEWHGDRLFADDLAIVGGIARVEGMPVTVVGHQKGKDTKDNIARHFGMPHPEGFRKALRFMRQADKFGRPIITFIDTPGAYPGGAAEERGQSEAIARNMMEMAGFGVPIIAVVIGEGGSGGALALGVANRVLMLEHAIYSVISPNGAASILWKDATKADQAAEAMKITSADLHAMRIIEEVIPEVRGGAHRAPHTQSQYIKEAIVRHLKSLLLHTRDELRHDRYDKFRAIGSFLE